MVARVAQPAGKVRAVQEDSPPGGGVTASGKTCARAWRFKSRSARA